MLSRNLEQAKVDVREEAIERFPAGEYTIFTTEWCDGDWMVEARHASETNDAGNSVVKKIIATPFGARFEVREVTSSESWNELHAEDIEL